VKKFDVFIKHLADEIQNICNQHLGREGGSIRADEYVV